MDIFQELFCDQAEFGSPRAAEEQLSNSYENKTTKDLLDLMVS